MFTLKLYRRSNPYTPGERNKVSHKVIAVHRIVVHEIGEKGGALELTAFMSNQNNDYETYYVGKPEEGMDGFQRDDLHLNSESGSWWGWGLLENWEGNTSEHYRPGNYG